MANDSQRLTTVNEQNFTDYDASHVLGAESGVLHEMNKKVKVLCWVMTQPKNHKERAIHIKRTWGKRCNVLFFVSSKEGTIIINIVGSIVA